MATQITTLTSIREAEVCGYRSADIHNFLQIRTVYGYCRWIMKSCTAYDMFIQLADYLTEY